MDLHLFDCSNYLYAGNSWELDICRGVREDDGEYVSNAAPIGATMFLMSQLASFMRPGNVVMPVFDSTPTIKRKMYEDTFGYQGYKANRKAAPSSVKLQKTFSRLICEKVGFQVQYAEGYESDDLIYTLAKMYEDDFNHIYIHTKDSDLFFLVNDKVTIAKVGEQGKIVTMENYSEACNKQMNTVYNVVLLNKLIAGDVSDNIPGIGYDWTYKFNRVLDTYELPKMGDLEIARNALRRIINAFPMAQGAHLILPTFDILCPMDVPKDMINDYDSDINESMLKDYILNGFNPNFDRWGIEDMVLDYIDKFFEE